MPNITADGNFVWAKNLGGDGGDWGLSIATDNQNNVFVTGVYNTISGGALLDTDPGPGVYNLPAAPITANTLFFAKYDSNGNFVWAHPLSNVRDNSSVAVLTVDKATNDVIVTGSYGGSTDFSFSNQLGATLNSVSMSNFVARYRNDGSYE